MAKPKRKGNIHSADAAERQPVRQSKVNPPPIIPTGDVRHMPWIRDGKLHEIRNTKKEGDKFANP